MPSTFCPRHWSLKQRLQHRSIRDPKTGCLLWTGSRTTNGYGNLTFKNRRLQAHRASWIVNRGRIPRGLLVCHRCDIRTCIDPNHLFLGTQKENMADKVAKQGHERRTEEGPERRPSKAPEIMRIEMLGREFVTRVLAIRPLDGQPSGPTPWLTARRSAAGNSGKPGRRRRS